MEVALFLYEPIWTYMFLHDRTLYEASHICHIYCTIQYLYDHTNSYTLHTRFIYDCSVWEEITERTVDCSSGYRRPRHIVTIDVFVQLRSLLTYLLTYLWSGTCLSLVWAHPMTEWFVLTEKLVVNLDPGLYFFINQGCLTVDHMDDKEEMQIVEVQFLSASRFYRNAAKPNVAFSLMSTAVDGRHRLVVDGRRRPSTASARTLIYTSIFIRRIGNDTPTTTTRNK